MKIGSVDVIISIKIVVVGVGIYITIFGVYLYMKIGLVGVEFYMCRCKHYKKFIIIILVRGVEKVQGFKEMK